MGFSFPPKNGRARLSPAPFIMLIKREREGGVWVLTELCTIRAKPNLRSLNLEVGVNGEGRGAGRERKGACLAHRYLSAALFF